MTPSTLATPPELCDAIYAAIAAPEHWPNVLEQCAKLSECAVMGLVILNKRSGATQCAFATGIGASPQAQESLQQLFSTTAAITGFAERNPQPGELLFAASGKALLSTLDGDYMVGWLARAYFDSLECFCLNNGRHDLFSLMMLRRADAPPAPSDASAELLVPRVSRAILSRDLVTHLSRALRVSLEFGDRQATMELGWKLMGSMHFGVLGLDMEGKACYANPRATELMLGNGLSIEDKRLCASDEDADLAIQHALKQILRTPPKVLQYTLRIGRPMTEQTLALTVMSVPPGNKLNRRGIAAVIYLTDPGYGTAPGIQAMQQLYGLTKGEASVAREIMAGKSMEACAQANGHSVATSRNLLKRVYQKTGTARQSELCALLQQSFPDIDVDRLQLLG